MTPCRQYQLIFGLPTVVVDVPVQQVFFTMRPIDI
jgi:hypothetical protein